MQTHGATPRVARHVSRGLRVVAMRQPRPTDWNARALGRGMSTAGRRGAWGARGGTCGSSLYLGFRFAGALKRLWKNEVRFLSRACQRICQHAVKVQLAAPSLGLGRRGWRGGEDMRALSSHLSQAPPGNEKFPLLLPGICLPRSLVPPLCISGEGTREP